MGIVHPRTSPAPSFCLHLLNTLLFGRWDPPLKALRDQGCLGKAQQDTSCSTRRTHNIKTMSGVPRSRIPIWNHYSHPSSPHHPISRPAGHRPQASLWSPLADTRLPRNRLGLGEVTRAPQRGTGGQKNRGTPSSVCRKQAPPVLRGAGGTQSHHHSQTCPWVCTGTRVHLNTGKQ